MVAGVGRDPARAAILELEAAHRFAHQPATRADEGFRQHSGHAAGVDAYRHVGQEHRADHARAERRLHFTGLIAGQLLDTDAAAAAEIDHVAGAGEVA